MIESKHDVEGILQNLARWLIACGMTPMFHWWITLIWCMLVAAWAADITPDWTIILLAGFTFGRMVENIQEAVACEYERQAKLDRLKKD